MLARSSYRLRHAAVPTCVPYALCALYPLLLPEVDHPLPVLSALLSIPNEGNWLSVDHTVPASQMARRFENVTWIRRCFLPC